MSLAIQGLTVRDPAGNRLLDDVSLRVPGDRNLVVIGETGSGKSLLAEALLGLLAPSLDADGQIAFADGPAIAFADRTALQARWADRIAFIPQEPGRALDPTMRVGRQVQPPRPAPPGKLAATLEAVDLAPEVLRTYPHALSGGMAQRVLVAAVALDEAPLIVADEPTKALDADRVTQTVDLLAALAAAGRQLVVVTHDHRVARAVGGTAAVLEAGRLVECGPTERVLVAPRAAYTRAWLDAEPDRWPPCAKCGATTALLLAAEGLGFAYGRGPLLFDAVDLHVHAGQVVALTGPSGTGKTTLGNLLVGLLPPTRGRVLWQGQDLARRPKPQRALRRRYQKLHQDPGAVFLPDRQLGTQLRDLVSLVPGLDLARALPPLLDRLKLPPALLHRYPAEISGGEAQRLALCRVLLLDPAVIVADEPTSRLDPVVQRQTMLLLRELVDERGLGLVLITHDPAIVAAIADHEVRLAAASAADQRSGRSPS